MQPKYTVRHGLVPQHLLGGQYHVTVLRDDGNGMLTPCSVVTGIADPKRCQQMAEDKAHAFGAVIETPELSW